MIIIIYHQEVADIIGADAREIIFTSGATESNNISVKGVGRFYKSKKNHVITTQTVGGLQICHLTDIGMVIDNTYRVHIQLETAYFTSKQNR